MGLGNGIGVGTGNCPQKLVKKHCKVFGAFGHGVDTPRGRSRGS